MIKSLSYCKKVRKTGGMHVFSIPKDIVEKMELKDGELIEIRVTKLEEK